jgi:hypothetical protein
LALPFLFSENFDRLIIALLGSILNLMILAMFRLKISCYMVIILLGNNFSHLIDMLLTPRVIDPEYPALVEPAIPRPSYPARK